MFDSVTLDDCLRKAAGRLGGGGEAMRQARWLLQHVTGYSHAELIARGDQPLFAVQVERLETLLQRRIAGEPLAYLLESAQFRGRNFTVSSAVLVPRPETEDLVMLALERIAGCEFPHCLELGAGSGVIAISLALESACRMIATDVSPDALAVARTNALTLGASVEFLLGDWYAPLAADQRFHLIVSNPPYIAGGDPHLLGDGLRFEPALALTDGKDGLSCIRKIVSGATSRLFSGGWLLFEHGYDQGAACRNLLQEAGFEAIFTHTDFAGHERISGGQILS